MSRSINYFTRLRAKCECDTNTQSTEYKCTACSRASSCRLWIQVRLVSAPQIQLASCEAPHPPVGRSYLRTGPFGAIWHKHTQDTDSISLDAPRLLLCGILWSNQFSDKQIAYLTWGSKNVYVISLYTQTRDTNLAVESISGRYFFQWCINANKYAIEPEWSRIFECILVANHTENQHAWGHLLNTDRGHSSSWFGNNQLNLPKQLFQLIYKAAFPFMVPDVQIAILQTKTSWMTNMTPIAR